MGTERRRQGWAAKKAEAYALRGLTQELVRISAVADQLILALAEEPAKREQKPAATAPPQAEVVKPPRKQVKWTPAMRRAQADRLRARWKAGAFDAKVKKQRRPTVKLSKPAPKPARKSATKSVQ